MANTKKYLSHLLQNTGITPACSEEERAAADAIAKIFENHGFTPEIQEFSASGMGKVTQAILGIAVFVGSVFAGIGGAVGIIGLLLTLAAATLFALERTGRPVLSNLGSGGLSQNVIAYHKASGPLASPRNRPVVVVAHYDSPREDLLCREPFAAYRPLMVKLLPFSMVAPAVMSVIRLFPVPDAAKIVLWLLIVLIALIPLANAVAIIANRFVLPYTSGAVSNKSSVAAMLGVMDAVSPYELGEEFPRDTPADEYFAEQQRILEEALAEAEAAAAAEAEAALAYPHELGEQDGDELSDGMDAAEGGSEVDGQDAEMEGDTDLTDGPFSASELEVIDGTATDLPIVDLGSTAMMPADDLQADATIAGPMDADAPDVEPGMDVDATISVDADAIHAADVIDGRSAAEPGMDADATISVDVSALGTEPGTDAAEPAGGEEGERPAPTGVQSALDLDAAEPEPKLPYHLNAAGNVRFGSEVIRGLGMLPESCSVVYEAPTVSETEQSTTVAVAGEDGASGASLPEGEALDARGELDPWDADASLDDAEGRVLGDEDARFDDSDEPANEDSDEDDAFEEEGYFPEVLEAEYEVIEDELPDSDEGEALGSDEAFSSTAEDGPVFDEDSVAEDGPVFDELVPATAPADEAGEGPMGESLLFDHVETPLVDGEDDGEIELGSTAVFNPADGFKEDGADASPDPSGTVAFPVRPIETVDSLMAQINGSAPAHPRRRDISVPSTADAPTPRIPQTANRASLFDLPDPSARPIDPFAISDFEAAGVPDDASLGGDQENSQDASALEMRSAFEVISSPMPPSSQGDGVFETISAPAPAQEKPRRGLSRFFGRKKKEDDRMSDWLGVDDSFDAKSSGSDIGSWDNFDDGWKGGAAGYEGATEEELREAVADMGDDELLGHDIWFVATGASENGNAGVRAFLDAHRDKLRGVFLINLESVGAGQLAMLSTEGEERVLKGDKRIMKLVQQVSSDFHHECAAVEMPYVTTDAHVAMGMSLRSLTIGGVEGTGFALSHTEEDQPFNVDTENVAFVSDIVTEVIRRS